MADGLGERTTGRLHKYLRADLNMVIKVMQAVRKMLHFAVAAEERALGDEYGLPCYFNDNFV